MKDTFQPKVFQLGSKAFGIRSEAIVPGKGKIDGPGYSLVIPILVFWCGDSWCESVCLEFSSREDAEAHLAANLDPMLKRAKKQFSASGATRDAVAKR